MMSMKEAGKPVSFVEDCAVPLEHLADYTARLTEIFEKNGTRGTWYAHAAVGCLHVRPVLNLRLDKDVRAMRAIAEEAFAMVREYKGSHSGEHGDGIVRSEFHEQMFGAELVRAFEEVKDRFDPHGLYNPGKIVRAPKFDDRGYFRYGPDYRAEEIASALDWSAYPGAGGGFQGAVEMCNNNGACRALAGGVMCPSYRVTRDERDVTRGRANTLRLAITGQLGPDALTSDDMAETLKLCVSCKACRRECPTGVDMARMKIEVLRARSEKLGLVAARPAGRLSAALRAHGRAGLAAQSARRDSGRGKLSRSRRRLQRAAQPAAVARGSVRRRPRSSATGRAQVATSCCSPTPSTAISSAKISMPRSRCWRGRLSRHVGDAGGRRDGRCAAAAPSCPSARSTRRAAKWSARSPRWRPMWRAACRWSGSSRAACSASATRCRR